MPFPWGPAAARPREVMEHQSGSLIIAGGVGVDIDEAHFGHVPARLHR